jgi:gamma-glutamylcyclotransferase (GGCT)/AIG2-like uncharacterized protein YtfP
VGLLVLTVARLFVYGTLLDPAVCGRLLGRAPEACDAILAGYSQRAVRGKSYPAVIPDDACRVAGLLLCGLSEGDLAALDVYEGDEYARIEVSVETDAGLARAWVYVWIGGEERLGPGA